MPDEDGYHGFEMLEFIIVLSNFGHTCKQFDFTSQRTQNENQIRNSFPDTSFVPDSKQFDFNNRSQLGW